MRAKIKHKKISKNMKNLKSILGVGVLAIAGFFTIAADHIDAPAVSGGSGDITDFYAFQGENAENLVFVANVQGLMSPAETAGATFSENVMVEFNIDTNDDHVEDLVIQAIPRDGQMYFFGPVAPAQTGLEGSIQTTAENQGVVTISKYNEAPILATNAGMRFFAGPRDDPFFMDFAQYTEIIAGNATGFNTPGTDTFAGTNVLSIVVEVPKRIIGNSGTINTWVTTNTK
jgi:hypothetical protein